ncbi:MAG: serine O-acetyltransferase, partial [Gammaproteobacteria bacterium]|nr:serine O-acetyltransferase [Gammaproteobacteria bacterium]
GAKVLGPITLGSGARVGSNAVVVKDVPENTTVVGIPGRLVAKAAPVTEAQQRREAMAKKIGFDAYGTNQEMPDPVAHAVNCILDHMHTVDQRLILMCNKMKELGVDVGDAAMPEMEACELPENGERYNSERGGLKRD